MNHVLFITSAADPLLQLIEDESGGQLDITAVEPGAIPESFEGFEVLVVGEVDLSNSIATTGANGPKFVQLLRGHHNSVDVLSLNREGVSVAGTAPLRAPQVANQALGLARVVCSNGHQKASVTPEEIASVAATVGSELAGKTLGLVGFGRIGQATAGLGAQAGMNVIYADVRTASHGSTSSSKARRSTLDLLLSNSDVVSLHVQWGPTSDPLISERELRLMQKGAVLLNTADERLIDQLALEDALQAGRIFAGLVVEDTAASAFSNLPNTIVTTYSQRSADQQIAKFVVANIESALSGQHPTGLIEIVDFPRAGDPAFWSSRMSPREC